MCARIYSMRDIKLPTGLGVIIAIIVAVFAALGLAGIIDQDVDKWQFGLILALAIAHLT